MKAVRMHGYGGVDQLLYEEAPKPVPGPKEVLVKLAATSINPIDWKIRRGDRKATVTLQFPVILGYVTSPARSAWPRPEQTSRLARR